LSHQNYFRRPFHENEIEVWVDFNDGRADFVFFNRIERRGGAEVNSDISRLMAENLKEEVKPTDLPFLPITG